MFDFIEKNGWIWNIINMLLVGFISCWAYKVNGWCYKKYVEKTEKVEIHRKFLKQLINGTITIICIYGIITQIPSLDYIVQAILTSSSLLVVVLGFAAQESISNVLSGIMLSVCKPFNIGDRVRLVNQGVTGIIDNITLRHTIIKTIENKRLIIPNNVMNKEMVENADFRDDEVCNFLDVTIAYESNIDLAIKIISKLVKEHKYYVDCRDSKEKESGEPAVKILIRELGKDGIILRCHIWTATTNQNFEMCSDLRYNIVKEFNRNNISIPYSHMHIVGDINNRSIVG